MKYAAGLMVGVLSRSVGSTTASHNRFGPYFRSRVIPVNPSSDAQVTQRRILTDASQAWRGLTALQRAGWATLGSTIVRLDSLAQEYTLTGLQAFTSSFRNLSYIGLTPIEDAYTLAGLGSVASMTLTADSSPQTISFAFTPTPVPSDLSMVIEATAGVSAGINFRPRSAYKLVAVVASAGTSPENALTNWGAIFGSVVAGTKIFFRTRYISESTGEAGPWLYGSTIAL